MEIKVRVKTRASENKIFEKGGIYFVHVKASPEKGKANKEVIKLLSRHFKSPVRIMKGFTSKEKVLRIDEE